MTKKFISIDFEYNSTAEAKLNLVCASLHFSDTERIEEYWLYENNYKDLKQRLLDLRKEYIFLAFNVVAEAQSFISLGLDPRRCQWVDLQLEWKMLINHCHEYAYGKQLIDGKEKFTTPPKNKWERSEEDELKANNNKPQKSLAAFLYKMLGVKVDTDHKNEMRDVIISNDKKLIEENKKDIQEYCTSDVLYLFDAWIKVKEAYRGLLKQSEMKNFFSKITYRGETAARTALMMSTGYPIDVQKTKAFSANVPLIIRELCEDINSQFDEDRKPFVWNNKEQRYSKQIKKWKGWIKESKYADKWLLTDKKDFSCSLKAFEKMFSYRHDFPRGNFFAQTMRYLKVIRSLNGFVPKGANAKDKSTFFDSLGSDGRVRSWLNPYGAQSARFQPKALGFLPLKASWMRSLIAPVKGKAIAAIDYKSQEFLIAALLSKDKNMISAYASSDVYLYFAKLAEAVPWDGKKEDYKEERNLFKSTTLGISYNMAKAGLARKLTDDTGKEVSEDEAQDLINKFEKAYPKYAKWIDITRLNYSLVGRIELKDGWITWGDNDNKRSISNLPIQGMGSCILRKAIALAQDAGLKVIFPLHDALYIEYDSENLHAIDTLSDCMREAFLYFFDDKEAAGLIGLDANIWSPDYKDGQYLTPKGMSVKGQTIYIDERSESEYQRFSKYFV